MTVHVPPALTAASPAVVLTHLRRAYGSRIVIENLNLRIERGEFVVLLGESGCGKTTLLRALAGLDPIDGGRIVAPRRPAVVFQEHRLLPWDSLWRNVSLGLQAPDARARARAALSEVGLGGRLDDWPRNLSGGQAQRVALARALVQEPELLLLDEPFAALDALTRIRMHVLVRELVALADRILVMREGRLAFEHRAKGDGTTPILRAELLAELGVVASPPITA
jgi:sulfonate transport system ATP-binding protein